MNKVQEKTGQTREIQHKPEQTWHYSCNLRQLSQDLYTWSHVTQAGNERQGFSSCCHWRDKTWSCSTGTEWQTGLSGLTQCPRCVLRKVKQTVSESISLRFIVNGADPRFVSWWHQIIALVLWFLALWETCCGRNHRSQKYRCTQLHLEGTGCILKGALHSAHAPSETYKSVHILGKK